MEGWGRELATHFETRNSSCDCSGPAIVDFVGARYDSGLILVKALGFFLDMPLPSQYKTDSLSFRETEKTTS